MCLVLQQYLVLKQFRELDTSAFKYRLTWTQRVEMIVPTAFRETASASIIFCIKESPMSLSLTSFPSHASRKGHRISCKGGTMG